MKIKKNRIFSVLTILVALVTLVYFNVPATAQPGDATDPLVTRRYVDERIAQLTAEMNALRAQIGTGGIGQIAPGLPAPPQTPVQPGLGVSQTERDALFAEIMIYFETVYGEMLRAAAGGGSVTGVPGAVVPFEAVFVPAGHTLLGHAGAEIILRSGNAVAVSGPDGMVNVTAGADLIGGQTVPHNNLLLVPRTDGRGMSFTTDAWLMVKGGYEIR